MRTRIAVGLVAAFTAGMVLVPMSARATCQQTIYAERGFSNGTTAQVLGEITSTDGFFWFANTTNAQLAALIFSAVAQRNRVFVTGDASTCPTTGTFRFMGNVIFITQQP